MSILDRYSAVIFDLDGTLADSMQVWDTICRDWAAGRGYVPPEDLDRTIALMTLDQSAEYVVRLFGLSETPGQVQQEWSRMVTRRYKESVRPKEGARELLEALQKKGVPMALATSGFPEACMGFLESNSMDRFFSAVVYTQDTGKDKTHPDVYLACARALDVPPEQCVVLEDLPESLPGVRRAGMGFVAVYDSSCKDWDALAAQADQAVRSFKELL